jgi:hypothetical protein
MSAYASDLPASCQPDLKWEKQMLVTAMATLPAIRLELEIALEPMSMLRRETAKDSA